ncbi:MAG: hypothetical protein HeimC2_41380 [Candidatus Heimdallarchaeota archaeon LC_2]|nr:MAG: hypothetical protein HeimC2_41380 [Candidatus Heimdallarchaeota archaeon LC_2]
MILRLNEWRIRKISIGKIKNLRITCAKRETKNTHKFDLCD